MFRSGNVNILLLQEFFTCPSVELSSDYLVHYLHSELELNETITFCYRKCSKMFIGQVRVRAVV